MREVKRRDSQRLPAANFIDRAISFISPNAAAKRMQSRIFMAISGAYYGGSKSRRALSQWVVPKGDADQDISPELEILRERSRDLVRNNPLAGGAIKTKVTSVVGTGLTLKSRIDREVLGLDEEAADKWENHTEAEWKLFSNSTGCDVEDTLNFSQIQELAFRSTLENGDVFVLTPVNKSVRRVYSLQLQLIEADRVSNMNNISDSETLSGGVERKKYGGAPVYYHVIKGHPGNMFSKNNEWQKIRVRGPRTGRRNILHLFHKVRVGQSRGVPDLAPVIESLKQLSRYTEAEINAAVISAFFTVFVTSEYGGAEGMFKNFGTMQPQTDIGGKTTDKDFKMGSGAIVDLATGEDVKFANPQRPNHTFDMFVLAICRQIGVAIELPFEILVKHFTASYSAARAALLEAWKFYIGRRKWLADRLCKPVYELWLTEAVLLGRVVAPGFLTGDPLIKSAWLGSEWIGAAKGAIDEQKEVGAARDRVEMGVSTLDEETISLTGGDWEKKHPQRAKEHKMRKEAGLISEERTPENETVVQDNGEER
jgi:lambda family phage portal protein